MGGTSIQIRGSYSGPDSGSDVTKYQQFHLQTIDVEPPELLQRFQESFGSFVGSFGVPWNATQHILDYMSYAASILIRGERSGDAPAMWESYVRLSGCAGMAQTSSEVAAHWIRTWANQRPTELSTLLSDHGFSVSNIEKDDEILKYFPTAECGYTSYWLDAADAVTEDEPWAGKFDIDVAAYDHLADGGLALARKLESVAGELMSDGICRCQLCNPIFDAERYAI